MCTLHYRCCVPIVRTIRILGGVRRAERSVRGTSTPNTLTNQNSNRNNTNLSQLLTAQMFVLAKVLDATCAAHLPHAKRPRQRKHVNKEHGG